jgi:hypothetical protein
MTAIENIKKLRNTFLIIFWKLRGRINIPKYIYYEFAADFNRNNIF